MLDVYAYGGKCDHPPSVWSASNRMSVGWLREWPMRNHLIALSTHRTRRPYDVSIVVGHGVKASVETQLDLSIGS